jgi:hypothetical protein
MVDFERLLKRWSKTRNSRENLCGVGHCPVSALQDCKAIPAVKLPIAQSIDSLDVALTLAHVKVCFLA